LEHSVSNQYYLGNSLRVSFLLYLSHVFTRVFAFRVEFYMYLVIMAVNFGVQKGYFRNNAHYVGEPHALLAVVVVHVVGCFVFGVLSGRGRANFKEN